MEKLLDLLACFNLGELDYNLLSLIFQQCLDNTDG